MEKELEQEIQRLKKELEEKEKMLSQFSEREKEKEEELKKLREKLEKVEREKRMQEFRSFCEELTMEGKLPPAQHEFVISMMEICHAQGEYEFSEGEKKNVLSAFKEFLKSLPKAFEYSEIATKDRAESPAKKRESYSGPVDEDRLRIHEQALELMEKENIAYIEAVKKVIEEVENGQA